jgi:hypothetical protein
MFDGGAIGGFVGTLAVRVNDFAEKLGAVLSALPGAPRAAAAVLAGSLGGLDGPAILVRSVFLTLICALVVALPRTAAARLGTAAAGRTS